MTTFIITHLGAQCWEVQGGGKTEFVSRVTTPRAVDGCTCGETAPCVHSRAVNAYVEALCGNYEQSAIEQAAHGFALAGAMAEAL